MNQFKKIMLQGDIDKSQDRNQTDLRRMMSELEDLLQVTRQIFSAEEGEDELSRASDLNDATPQDMIELQLSLQEQMLEKLNSLEKELRQFEANPQQVMPATPSPRTSLFGPL